MTLAALSQDPTDPDFVQNPYPFYDRARGFGPLFYWSDYKMVATTTYAATNTILRDRRFGREPIDPPEFAEHCAPFYAVEAHSMLELEPPRHTRLRGLVLRAFTSRRIKELAPEIEKLCHQLIEAFPREPFNILHSYCTPIPVVIIARLLGVPDSMAPDLLRWSNAMVSMYQARRTTEIEVNAANAAQEFSDFLKGYIETRRAQPADDLITHLILAEQEGEKLTTDELITTCILLLNAGHEATVHTLGNGVKTLLESPFNHDWLSPIAIEKTVEEILRFDPPLHMFTRYAYENMDLFGHSFSHGDQVACLLAAAGRDPKIARHPGTFRPSQDTPTHQAFGAGLHFCVGAPLARLEIQIALQVLFKRCPNLQIVEPPRYANVYHFHGLEALVVRSA